MPRLPLLLFFLFLALGLAGQAQYDQQVRAVESMLERGRFGPARVQARALAQSGREAQLPVVEARGHYLYGRAILEDPSQGAKQRVEGIRALQRAATGFRDQKMGATVDSIVARLEAVGGATEVDLPRLRELARQQGKVSVLEEGALDESALSAIVALQNREIAALNDTQVRQLLVIQQKDLELNQYEFDRLNDSLLLIGQEMLLEEQRALTREEKQRRNFFVMLALGVFVALGLLYSRYRSSRRYQAQLQEKNSQIEEERERSEGLLLNILPARVADELKRNGKATARHFTDTSVMFSDFVGFSRIAAGLNPEQLVDMLDETFRAFDGIIERHGLEKIKTIGDAYMCASGVPVPREDHAARAVRAALDLQTYLARNPSFSARIGIHSGPVVAGVVGQKKFAYDIWGDTVNQAARLEASGRAGEVIISEATRQLLGPEFECTEVGTFEAKNIGTMNRYAVRERVATHDGSGD